MRIVYNGCMPYNYTHAMMGLNALKIGEKETQAYVLRQEASFLLGTMGADPYFGDAFPPPVGNRARTDLADLLHALDGRRLFAAMLPLCGDNDALFCYTLGFLCHFLLDNRTHPYISSRFPGKLHTPAEIAIEPLMVERGGDPRFLTPPTDFYTANGTAAVDALHARLFWRLFALRTEGLYCRALRKWLRVNDLQFDPHGKKRALLRPLPGATCYLLTFGMPDERDLLNLRHTPWGADRHAESFPELFDAASREAAAQIALAVKLRDTGEYTPLLQTLEGRTADAAERI